MPENEWFFHRIAASKYYSAGLVEIQEQWPLETVLDAHIVLDGYDALNSG